MTHITEIVGMQGAIVSMHDIFEFQGRGVDANGRVMGHLQPTGLRPHLLDRLAQFGEHVPHRHLPAAGARTCPAGNG